MDTPPSLAELTAFGIGPEDEGPHPFDPDVSNWNESIFYDWYDDAGSYAGHCRIGVHPNQGRVFLWLYLWDGERWAAIEEPRLPLSDLDWSRWRYDRFGLRFEREVLDPLRADRLRLAGTARIVSGRGAGRFAPLSVDLRFDAMGPAHSIGSSGVSGHSSDGAPADRFEQPVRVSGTCVLDGAERAFQGRGERDHSWGPRYWNMQWHFLALHGEGFRLQCARIDFDEDSSMEMGYVGRAAETVDVSEVRFDLAYDDASVERPYRGRLCAVSEKGERFEGTLEPITATAIDLSHCFEPPQPSTYRRALMRFTPDDGGAPALGWLEVNRFPHGVAHDED